jgi:hypothetical protein
MKKEPVGIRSARIQAVAIIIAALITALFTAWYKGCFNPKPGNTVRTSGDSSPAIVASGEHGTIYNVQGNLNIYGDQDTAKAITDNLIKPDPKEKRPWQIRHKGKVFTLEEGKHYTYKFTSDIQIDYMLKNGLMHVEYVAPNGTRWYYVISQEGNIVDQKFPYKLEDFKVIIPEDLELSRKTTSLPNGFRKIDVKLKWGKSVSMVVDSNHKLKQLTIVGGARISPSKKTISPEMPKKENQN